MIKKLTLGLLLSGCVSWAIADSPERLISGMGASVSASTTQAVLVIEQAPNAEVITNGTFATDTAWYTNTCWAIGSGVATFTTNGVTTNDVLYQTISPCTTDKTYRLVYTATIDGPVTITPQLGTAKGTTQTASGTFTEELYLNSTNRISFTCLATDAATVTVDNVTMRIVPEEAHACNIELSVAKTDIPVYVSYNCDTTAFSNIYAKGRALIVDSNAVVTIVRDDKEPAIGVRRLWYRTASGGATLRVNAN